MLDVPGGEAASQPGRDRGRSSCSMRSMAPLVRRVSSSTMTGGDQSSRDPRLSHAAWPASPCGRRGTRARSRSRNDTGRPRHEEPVVRGRPGTGRLRRRHGRRGRGGDRGRRGAPGIARLPGHLHRRAQEPARSPARLGAARQACRHRCDGEHTPPLPRRRASAPRRPHLVRGADGTERRLPHQRRLRRGRRLGTCCAVARRAVRDARRPRYEHFEHATGRRRWPRSTREAEPTSIGA